MVRCRTHGHALRKLLRYLHDEGTADLTKHVPRVPIPAPRDVIVTEAERDLIFNTAPMYLRCWLLLCSDLALRSGTAARASRFISSMKR
jgi:hypothetical protein